MHERPTLPLVTQAAIERAREQVVSRRLLRYSILFSPETLGFIEAVRGSPVQRKPAALKLALQGYSAELFNAEAGYYLEHTRDEPELRSWLIALAACVKAEIIQERRKHIGYEMHCTASEQERAVDEELKQRIDNSVARFRREASSNSAAPDGIERLSAACAPELAAAQDAAPPRAASAQQPTPPESEGAESPRQRIGEPRSRSRGMADSPDALIDVYLSDQWRIHGGPRKKSAREEVRDRLIPPVVKALGSVESSLDVLLKESPCSNGHGINTLIHAYELYFLRMRREAVEGGDQAAERRFADLQDQFHELDEYEKNLFGTAERQDNERIHATLRTSVCNLPNLRPAASTVLDPFQQGASARPLGDNPFPPDHPAYDAFEEATWEVKAEIGRLQAEFLTPANTPGEVLQSIFKYRTRYFNVVAKKAICIVGNDETARWYESWIDALARFYLDDTLSRIKRKDPGADPAAPPFFSPEDLASFEGDLTLELMRIVRHYKTEAASIVLRIKQGQEKTETRADRDLDPTAKKAPKPTRRNARYTAIDNALRDIARSKPRSHEEVFKYLDGRVAIPFAEPFQTARGWVAGFDADPEGARAWLSKVWSQLGLPAFPKGPK